MAITTSSTGAGRKPNSSTSIPPSSSSQAEVGGDGDRRGNPAEAPSVDITGAAPDPRSISAPTVITQANKSVIEARLPLGAPVAVA